MKASYIVIGLLGLFLVYWFFFRETPTTETTVKVG